MIPQDHLRRVVAGRTGDAAAGMRAGAAKIKSAQRTAIIRMTQHRPRREQLIERQRAVEDIAADQAEVRVPDPAAI